MITVPDSFSLEGALQPGGALARDFERVWDAIWRQNHIAPALLELARLRLAVIHGAEAECTRRGVIEIPAHKRDAVLDGSYDRDASFTPAERALLEFAEIYAQDPAAIADEQADAVKQHFGEPGLVCLVESLGFIDGRMRLARVFAALQSTGAA